MAKREFNSKGRFTPKGKSGKHNSIDVSSPKLAKFLSELEAGSSVLAEDLTSSEAVGSIDVGDVFLAGTSLEEVIRRILEGTPTAGIQSFSLLDENQSLIPFTTTNMAGDELTIGGIRFSYEDPAGLVTEIVYAPVDEATETVTGTAGLINNVDVTTDYTAGGPSSDFSYGFASGGNGNVSRLSLGFGLKLNDTEDNQIGNTKNTSLAWTPPAFMLNMATDGSFAWGDIAQSIENGIWSVVESLYLQALSVALGSSYYPLIRHSKSGNYSGSDVDDNNDPITWEYPAEYATGHRVGFGEQGGDVTFWEEGGTEYKQVWFMPAGGQASTYVNASAGSFTFNPTPLSAAVELDISSNPTTGLGFSTSTAECRIQYIAYVSPQTNSIFPGTSSPIIFNT